MGIPPQAQALARGLIQREIPESAVAEAAGPAMQRICARISMNLRRSLGDDGCDALLSRALSRTESEHPALKDARSLTAAGIELDGVLASIERHGPAAVRAGVEALLSALIDLLGRLIGEDMAISLIDSPPPPTNGRTAVS